ncbi:MAG: serine/threonine-protein kinase [Myxococcota bacterium]
MVQANQRKSAAGSPAASGAGAYGLSADTVSRGRYALIAPLARGGMADVHLARDTATGAEVVIKRVRKDLPADAGYDRLLVAEAQLTRSLRHPNVVDVLDHGRDGATSEPFIVLEYVAGLDLHQLLRVCSRRKIRLPLALRLAVVTGLLSGVAYVHRARDGDGRPFDIVHRDISPANVLVSFDGRVKLCDFGIATATVMPDVPATSGIEGKASYMSPEQARGEPLDGRSDVYSVGVLLWEMLAGRRMRKKQGTTSRLVRAARGEVPPLSVRGFEGEAELHAIVRRALAVDREDRFRSAAELREALMRWGERPGCEVGDARALRLFLAAELSEVRREQRAVRDRACAEVDPNVWRPDADDDRATPSHSGPRRRRAVTTVPSSPRRDRRWVIAAAAAAALASYGIASAVQYLLLG